MREDKRRLERTKSQKTISGMSSGVNKLGSSADFGFSLEIGIITSERFQRKPCYKQESFWSSGFVYKKMLWPPLKDTSGEGGIHEFSFECVSI